MHDFGASGPPDGGVVAGRSLASLLDVDLGDTVALTSTDTPASVVLAITGFVDEPLGTLVYSSVADVAPFEKSAPLPSAMVSFADGVDRDAMRETLTQVPGVVAYVDSRALYDTAQSFLALFYAFVGVMLAFGGVMAFALIFNTAAVNAAERAPRAGGHEGERRLFGAADPTPRG